MYNNTQKKPILSAKKRNIYLIFYLLFLSKMTLILHLLFSCFCAFLSHCGISFEILYAALTDAHK